MCSGFGNSDCPYNTPKREDYQLVFTGLVSDFNHSRTPTENTVEVICKSFDVLLVEGINENYPNSASYMAAGYLDAECDSGAGPNGSSKPRAYDGWKLDKAIRDMCLHAGIDSSLLYERDEQIGRAHV